MKIFIKSGNCLLEEWGGFAREAGVEIIYRYYGGGCRLSGGGGGGWWSSGSLWWCCGGGFVWVLKPGTEDHEGTNSNLCVS